MLWKNLCQIATTVKNAKIDGTNRIFPDNVIKSKYFPVLNI